MFFNETAKKMITNSSGTNSIPSAHWIFTGISEAILSYLGLECWEKRHTSPNTAIHIRGLGLLAGELENTISLISIFQLKKSSVASLVGEWGAWGSGCYRCLILLLKETMAWWEFHLLGFQWKGWEVTFVEGSWTYVGSCSLPSGKRPGKSGHPEEQMY